MNVEKINPNVLLAGSSNSLYGTECNTPLSCLQDKGMSSLCLNHSKLQFITHYNSKYSYIHSAQLALEGGCRWIQLRMKQADNALLEETAILVQKLCKAYGATFIIDDHVWLAQKIHADGVHLGKNDMPVAQAKKLLGKGYIIGSTVNSFTDIQQILQTATPDYFGCGPFRFTTTKQQLAPILGVEGYQNILANMKANNIHIPLVAIGGISKADIAPLLACGVHGIALSSSVLNANNPVQEMNETKSIIFNNHLTNTLKK
jgi:thiamine-phosphate pyrophosphorylase